MGLLGLEHQPPFIKIFGKARNAISCRTHCICPPGTERKCTQRRQVPGSNAFVPSVVGLIIAGEVIKDLTGFKGRGIGA